MTISEVMKNKDISLQLQLLASKYLKELLLEMVKKIKQQVLMMSLEALAESLLKILEINLKLILMIKVLIEIDY